jgi:hypothetical protein
MATPLIRIPQEQGGTMYAFASAAKDLTKAYYNPDLNFEYSKFALLNLPSIDSGSGNLIDFSNLFDAGTGGVAAAYSENGNGNIDFAQTFQNYALNLESFILTDDDYDSDLLKSDSEKIFFKWLDKIGAISTRQANSFETSTSRLIELDNNEDGGSEYDRVIKYIGDIDVSNDKNYKGTSYNEIFINVPSSVGYTPCVLLESSQYNTNATSYDPESYIIGRNLQTHPDPNLNLEALSDNISGTLSINNIGDVDYGIDWNSVNYDRITGSSDMNNIFDYSKSGGDFKFNAILIYYDVSSKSNPGNGATNLYGILILDNWKADAGSGYYIPQQTKYKPNEVTGLNGNSFALKLNVKFNSSLDNVGVENNINDFSTFSMDLFFDATSSIEEAGELLKTANEKYNKIAERLDSMESIIMTSSQLTDIIVKVDELETSVENATLNFADSSSLIDLITSTNKRINQIISGEIPTELVLNNGNITSTVDSGIQVFETTEGKVGLKSLVGGYNLGDTRKYDVASGGLSEISATSPIDLANSTSEGVFLRVKPFDNKVRINSTGELSNNLNIYLDDSGFGWSKGQVVNLSFSDDIIWTNTATNTNINIQTGKHGDWTISKTINNSKLISTKPYIEVICTDPVNKTFEIDIIR